MTTERKEHWPIVCSDQELSINPERYYLFNDSGYVHGGPDGYATVEDAAHSHQLRFNEYSLNAKNLGEDEVLLTGRAFVDELYSRDLTVEETIGNWSKP